jgi:hypothetical protein
MPTVQDAMPPGTPDRLRVAKMKRLIERGLVDGCGCGCRGDYYLTEKGKYFLEEKTMIAGEDIGGGAPVVFGADGKVYNAKL